MARTVGDIRSDIDVGCGDNAVKWRPQEPEGFECVQSIDISLICGYFSLGSEVSSSITASGRALLIAAWTA